MKTWLGRNHSNHKLSVKERFLEKVNKTENCWLWMGYVDKIGYGIFSGEISSSKAHRNSYDLFIGKIPTGKKVLHKCDVRNCVNPEHLFIGTQKDNVQDMLKKGRNRSISRPGDKNPMAKLNEKKVIKMRQMKKNNPDISYKKMADFFGISTMTAFRAITKRSWNENV